jgi:protein farnesyltransferase/geranylgeranyltransferase type-1 subunit alpha
MSRIATLPSTEPSFLALMLSKDAKNYHVWSYRQWLVRHFSLWDSELDLIESFLRDDVRNNSAWNHRWFLIFGRVMNPTVDSIVQMTRGGDKGGQQGHGTGFQAIDPAIIQREITYAQAAIRLAPQNQSPWNYLRGVLKAQGDGLGELAAFAEEFGNVDHEDEVRSSHALDFLADCYAERREPERADKALEILARRYDPIRRNYWNYRRGLLGVKAVAA